LLLRSRFARLLAGFGLASLALVVTGVVVCTAAGVPTAVALRNLAAWGVGAALATGLAFGARRNLLPIFLWLLPAGLLAGFLSPDLQGVHRWLALGPVQANIAMLFGPAAVVAFAASGDVHPLRSWIGLLTALALTIAQPDASQAAALAAVGLLAAWLMPGRPAPRLILAALAVGGAVWAGLRPDPLAPVPEVEGVIGLAFAQSAPLGVLSLGLLLMTAASPTLGAAPGYRLPGLALGVLLIAWSAAPFVGAFPVPFLGIGPSPIIGAWLGVGLLASLLRPQRTGVRTA
jgi:cell division protein FtsW (lipid II flippase)